MNERPPKLRHHVHGQWFVRWGGQDRYLGTDRKRAHERYMNDPVHGLQAWAAWRAARSTRRMPPLRSCTLREIRDRFLEAKEVAAGDEARRYYEKHLVRFDRMVGDMRADMVRPSWLVQLVAGMQQRGYKPKTVNHDLMCVKGMLTWAATMELAPMIPLRGIRSLSVDPPDPKVLTVEEVRAVVARAPDKLRPWLALTYLCLLRPSETIRVVHGLGEWVDDYGQPTERRIVYRIRSKVERKTRKRRHVVFSAEALSWLAKARPIWSRLDSFSQACRAAVAVGPKLLQKSAATHLLQAGVGRATADLLLGHEVGRVSATYARTAWTSLAAVTARLTLRTARTKRARAGLGKVHRA